MRSLVGRAVALSLASSLAWSLASGSGRAQAPAVAPPAVPSPAPPPVTLTQPPVPGAPVAPAPGPAAGLATLVPQPGDTGDVDEVVLPARTVAILSGQASWDSGLKTMRATFRQMQETLDKAGIKVIGRPVTVFTETTDDSFKYDAMLPIEAPPGPPPSGAAAGPAVRFGTTPSGKAYRFVHKGPYDEIDATYETITAYLDAKDVVAKDAFIEEYLVDTADPADTSLEINIFVQPK